MPQQNFQCIFKLNLCDYQDNFVKAFVFHSKWAKYFVLLFRKNALFCSTKNIPSVTRLLQWDYGLTISKFVLLKTDLILIMYPIQLHSVPLSLRTLTLVQYIISVHPGPSRYHQRASTPTRRVHTRDTISLCPSYEAVTDQIQDLDTFTHYFAWLLYTSLRHNAMKFTLDTVLCPTLIWGCTSALWWQSLSLNPQLSSSFCSAGQRP